MLISKGLINLIIVIFFFNGCATVKEEYFSYKVGSYTLDTARQSIYSDYIISYGEYLFEFKNRINIVTNIKGTKSLISQYDDTIGVYLLSKSNLYFEFDTFALKNKLVKTGKFTDKQFGYKFKNLSTKVTSEVSFTPPKDTLINNIECFITEIVSTDKSIKDSFIQKIILLKHKNLNSLYKMNGIKYTDNNYCIVGVQVYDVKNKAGFFQNIESFRSLTRKEKEICNSMIKKVNDEALSK